MSEANKIKELTGTPMLVWNFDYQEVNAETLEVLGMVSSNPNYPIICKSKGGYVVTRMNAKPLPQPWEVAPEGMRIVTEEERSSFAFPSDCVVYGHATGAGYNWHKRNHHAWIASYSLAAPLDYTFEEPEATLLVDGKEFSLATVKEALKQHTTWEA